MKRLLLIGICFCAFFTANAQVKSFSVTADKQRIVIGEQIKLEIKVVSSAKAKFPWIKIDTIPHFEVQSATSPDSLEQGKDLLIHQSITITSWDSGDWEIPVFSFEGKKSAPIKVKVGFSSFDPKQDYHDIKDVFEVKKPPRVLWYWYLLLFLLLVSIIILVFPSGRKDKSPKELKREDPGAYKKAMSDLKKLDQEYQSMPAKLFFTELKDILRTYLSGRKNIDSFVLTNDMILEAIRRYNIPPPLTEAVEKSLERGALAKFAKHEPAKGEMQESLNTIRTLIMEIENKS